MTREFRASVREGADFAARPGAVAGLGDAARRLAAETRSNSFSSGGDAATGATVLEFLRSSTTGLRGQGQAAAIAQARASTGASAMQG